MEEKTDFSLNATKLQTYVGFTSFMTAVGIFFAGLLLSSFHNYDDTVKVPIAYLIISIFGFLYSSLIYASGSQEAALKREYPMRRDIALGDVISEYLGVYFLVISVPMVVGAVTNDLFLRSWTIFTTVAGLGVYQFSQASLVERHFEGGTFAKLISLFILSFTLALFVSQIYSFYLVQISTVFIVLMLLVAYFAARRIVKRYRISHLT